MGDEIVQLQHALPMQLRLPYNDSNAAGGGEGSTPEIMFAAGFGGPVAADGMLPRIEPAVPRGAVTPGGPGADDTPYRRRRRRPT